MAYGILNACAIGMASGIMIAKVPQELPVANDTNAPNRKMKAGTRTGENCILCIVSTMKLAVPKPLIMLPSDHASTSVIATSVTLHAVYINLEGILEIHYLKK